MTNQGRMNHHKATRAYARVAFFIEPTPTRNKIKSNRPLLQEWPNRTTNGQPERQHPLLYFMDTGALCPLPTLL